MFWTRILACLLLLVLCCGCGDDPQSPPPADSPLVIDQENLTDGRLLGQGFGRFSDRDGHGDPDGATWPAFDVSGLGLRLEPGRKYAFSLSSADTCGYLYGPEETGTYAGGAAWRRNLAVIVGWVELPGRDFCFRTWVDTTGVSVACKPVP